MNRDATGANTPVRRLHERLIELGRPVSGLTEEARAERNRQLAAMVTSLAAVPSESLEDVWRKVTIVGDRLRAEGQALTSTFGSLTLLLLDSARDDLVRLAMLSASPGSQRGRSSDAPGQ